MAQMPLSSSGVLKVVFTIVNHTPNLLLPLGPNDDCELLGSFFYDSTIETAEPAPTGSDTYIEFLSDGYVVDDDGGLRA